MSAEEQQLRNQIESIAAPLREKILNLIDLSAEDILNENKREATMQGKPNSSAETGKKN